MRENKIILTDNFLLNIFENALSNSYSLGNSTWLEISYEEKDYNNSKNKLSCPCFEEVLIQIIKDGNSLKAIISDYDEMGVYINLEKLKENMNKIPDNVIANYLTENDDAEDGDLLLQSLILGEVIFC